LAVACLLLHVADISFGARCSPTKKLALPSAAVAPLKHHGRRITWHQTGKSFSLPNRDPVVATCNSHRRCCCNALLPKTQKQNEIVDTQISVAWPCKTKLQPVIVVVAVVAVAAPILFACCSISMAPNLCRGTQVADTGTDPHSDADAATKSLALLVENVASHLGHRLAAKIRVIDNQISKIVRLPFGHAPRDLTSDSRVSFRGGSGKVQEKCRKSAPKILRKKGK